MEQPYSDTNAGLHYDLSLHLDPQNQYISVRGSAAYQSPMPRLERARFYLHRQLAIQRVEGRRVLGYHHDLLNPSGVPFMPHAAVLDVYFDPPLKKGETALIQFEYAGKITEWPVDSANVVTPDWVEMGLYLPWFPMQYENEPSILTFTLKVTCTPGYQVASIGRSEFADGGWFYNWPHPTSDIVVTAGPTLEPREYTSLPNHVLLNASTFSESTAAHLGEDLLWALERFAGWFGPTRPSDFSLIESPRTLGGGYARRGLVVLSGITELEYNEQREAYLRYLAHEAAHAWWWQAPSHTWEDWLNESFAEYAALLAVRERFGAETFENFLAHKQERVSAAGTGAGTGGAGPLWEFHRAGGTTPEKQAAVERILYDKGPLLLHELAVKIGYTRFFELCRAMLWSGVTTTRHFLDLLEEVEDAPVRQWMEERLRA
jgi:hypothetical protein